MEYIIREMQLHEYPLLDDFLYEAIFQRDETNLALNQLLKSQNFKYILRILAVKKTIIAYVPKLTLAVQKDNYAVKMYLNVGFQIIEENEEEYIMVQYLQ